MDCLHSPISKILKEFSSKINALTSELRTRKTPCRKKYKVDSKTVLYL